jgi:hypothetical protein
LSIVVVSTEPFYDFSVMVNHLVAAASKAHLNSNVQCLFVLGCESLDNILPSLSNHIHYLTNVKNQAPSLMVYLDSSGVVSSCHRGVRSYGS